MMKKIKTFIRRPFLFVAAGIALTAFAASCSKNENTEVPLAAEIIVDNTGGTPKNARLECDDNGNFALLIYTESDENNFIRIQGNTATHHNKEIDLTAKENPQAGKRTWSVDCRKNGKTLFAGSGDPQTMPVFKAGKLTVDFDVNTGNYNVILTGGKIQADNGDNGDGKEHTLHIKTARKAVVKKAEKKETPKPEAAIVVDNMPYTVHSARLDYFDNGNFTLLLYTADDKKECIWFRGNMAKHNKRETDLTVDETLQKDQWGWIVCHEKDAKFLFTGVGTAQFKQLFKTGKLTVDLDVENGNYNVTLTDGKMQNTNNQYGNGNEHTIAIKVKGQATLRKMSENSEISTAEGIAVDGDKIDIKTTEIIKKDNGDFMLYLYTSADRKRYIRIVGNADRHNNREIDLKKAEEKRNGVHNYIVEYKKGDKIIFTGAGNPDLNLLFKAGKLNFNVDLNSGVYSVVLKGGIIYTTDTFYGDGNGHTVTIDTTGKATVKKS